MLTNVKAALSRYIQCKLLKFVKNRFKKAIN